MKVKKSQVLKGLKLRNEMLEKAEETAIIMATYGAKSVMYKESNKEYMQLFNSYEMYCKLHFGCMGLGYYLNLFEIPNAK
jgi:hypothetical protein